MIVLLFISAAFPSLGRRVGLHEKSSSVFQRLEARQQWNDEAEADRFEKANMTSSDLPRWSKGSLAALLLATPPGFHASGRGKVGSNPLGHMQLRSPQRRTGIPLVSASSHKRARQVSSRSHSGLRMDLQDVSKLDEMRLSQKRDSLEKSRVQRGISHPDTLKTLLDYSVELLALGREEEANPLLNEAMAEIVLDLNHPDKLGRFTLDTLQEFNQYADRLSKLSRKEQAEQLKTEILEVLEVQKEWECSQEEDLEDDDLEGCLAEDPIEQVQALKATLSLEVKTPEPSISTKNVAVVETKPDSERVMEDYSAFEATDKKIAIAMFDFDQTLSVEHVFLTLSQYATSSKRSDPDLYDQLYSPTAVSPAGQVSRLANEHDKYNADWAFGGAERIEAIRDMLDRLQARGVKMMICTLGFPAVQKKLLEEADLLKYFGWDGVPPVVGVSGVSYQPYFTKYDLDAAKEYDITEHPDEILKVNKVKLLDSLLQKESVALDMQLPLTAGVLVEDDTRMISLAKVHRRQDDQKRAISTGNIKTVRVTMRNGMQADVEMKEVLELAEA